MLFSVQWSGSYTLLDVFGSYHVISIEVGSFYPQPNMVPWWEALNTAIKTLRGKRLPLSDVQLHEQFKKTFGYKKAINCKVLMEKKI